QEIMRKYSKRKIVQSYWCYVAFQFKIFLKYKNMEHVFRHRIDKVIHIKLDQARLVDRKYSYATCIMPPEVLGEGILC
ncbi:34240_t:CDS:1, partial [Gigaspora margarita]